ncbi:hypothetical protein BD779DRAFT_1788208 [Infundibulicybe gibba]|nr:hypothetical protein BD779DRAFT_1788208 [Infundibulicybe gibba]
MFKLNVIILLLPGFSLASLAPRDRHVPAFLRRGTVDTSRALGLEIRQPLCAFLGDFLCPSGLDCCPSGTFCNDISGGCCPIRDETCELGGASGACPNLGDMRCSHGCCPAGWKCSGATKCIPLISSSGQIVAGLVTTSTTSIITTTSRVTPTTSTGTGSGNSGSTSGVGGSNAGSGGASRATSERGSISIVAIIALAASLFAL